MGEVETSDHCSKWEEEMYWTHFQIKHFSVYLVGDLTDELAIPKKFANYLKKKLLEAVTLKGPSGVTWDAELVTDGDYLFFKKGWKEFVISHSLKENDLLIFQYNGDSQFDVLMFDQHSSCEKETSYFVRKCEHKNPDVGYQEKENGRGSSVEDIPAASDDDVGHKKADVGCQTTEKTRESSAKVIHAELDDNIGSPLPKKARKGEAVMPIRRNAPRASRKIRKVTQVIKHATRGNISKKKPSSEAVMPIRRNAPRASRKIRKVTQVIKHATRKRNISKKRPSTPAVGEKVISDNSDAGQNSINGSRNYQPMYLSKRRPITEIEKQKALRLAKAASSSGSFIVVMRPTHVYKRFYMLIPSKWEKTHLSPVNQDIILLYKDNTWCVRYNCDKRGFGGLIGGWSDFSVDNNLEEFDVCVFELGLPAGSTVVLNVSIFRVVEELRPLIRVTAASSSVAKSNQKMLGESQ